MFGLQRKFRGSWRVFTWFTHPLVMCLIYAWKQQERELSHVWKRTGKLTVISDFLSDLQTNANSLSSWAKTDAFTFRPSCPGSPGGPVTPGSPWNNEWGHVQWSHMFTWLWIIPKDLREEKWCCVYFLSLWGLARGQSRISFVPLQQKRTTHSFSCFYPLSVSIVATTRSSLQTKCRELCILYADLYNQRIMSSSNLLVNLVLAYTQMCGPFMPPCNCVYTERPGVTAYILLPFRAVGVPSLQSGSGSRFW